MQNKRRLCLMTVFLPRENIFFVEEWLEYHIAIGFNHFYLYNNMNSRYLDGGYNIEINKKNKRGENIYDLTADKTDEEVQQDLDRILEPFVKKGLITQVKWQPLDENGQITYGIKEAFVDFHHKYSKLNDWVCFTDMDEFIVPLKHRNVQPFLQEMEEQGNNYIIMPQKYFASRFAENCQPTKSVLHIFKCSDTMLERLATKTIIKTDVLNLNNDDKVFNPHLPNVFREKAVPFLDKNVIRFNHYKYNDWEINWTLETTKRKISLDSIDKSILEFYNK